MSRQGMGKSGEGDKSKQRHGNGSSGSLVIRLEKSQCLGGAAQETPPDLEKEGGGVGEER